MERTRLVLTGHPSQQIKVGDTVLKFDRKVKVTFEAPPSVRIVREKVEQKGRAA